MELTLDQALQKGVEAHKAGKAQEADRYYTAILKANPKHPDANHNMGVLAVGVGKVEEALPFFKTAIGANPDVAQYWLSYINALIQLERMADAKAVLDQAKSNGAKGDGFDQLEKRLISSPSTNSNTQEPPQEQLQSLINLYTQGQYQEALTQASQLLKQFPNSMSLYNISGATNKQLGKLEEAVEAYRKAIALKPEYADAYYNMGNALKEQGKLDEAIEAYSKAQKINPGSAKVNNRIGNLFSKKGNLEEAIEAYDKAISLEPNFPEAFYNMGNILNEQGKPAEAIVAYKKAISIKPNYADAYNNLANVLRDQDRLEEAVEAYTKALSLKPEFAHAYYNIGIALKEQGKLKEAIEAYTSALSVKPNYAEAYNNMGVILEEQGKLEKAIEAYQYALSIQPDYTEAFYNIGNVLNEQGKLDEAIEAYRKALSIKPDYAEAYSNMGLTLKKDQGKLGDAIEAFNNALSINPDYAEAHRNLSTIKKYTLEDKQFHHAQELYKRKDLSEDERCSLSFAIAKMYDDIGELDHAFKHLSKGNNLRKKLLNYSINQDKDLFTKLKKTQPHLLKSSLEITGVLAGPKPIFILGMPRSGTTLVEQIISAQSEVWGAGELNHLSQFGGHLVLDAAAINTATISEFRKMYLSQLSNLSNESSVTDKMPQNFLLYH